MVLAAGAGLLPWVLPLLVPALLGVALPGFARVALVPFVPPVVLPESLGVEEFELTVGVGILVALDASLALWLNTSTSMSATKAIATRMA